LPAGWPRCSEKRRRSFAEEQIRSLLESLKDIGDQGAGEILGEAPEGWGIFLEKAG
jgi:hypothetical protein